VDRPAGWQISGVELAAERELSRLLIYLEAPGVVKKTLDLLDAAAAQKSNCTMLPSCAMSELDGTLADRRRYFEWWLKPRQNLKRPPYLVKWFADVGRSLTSMAPGGPILA